MNMSREQESERCEHSSVFTRLIRWIDNIHNIFKLVLALLVLSVIISGYQIRQSESRTKAISTAAGDYAPLMRECLELSSTLDCLGQLKLIADTESFEAAKSVAINEYSSL